MSGQLDVGRLADDEVKEMLGKLSRHFSEPVMPVGQYCAALNLWASALRMKVERAEAVVAIKPESEYAKNDLKEAMDFAKEVSRVFMMIDKSNLLSRLIYQGESLRTEMCPVHKGVWSGCTWSENVGDACACQHAQNGAIGMNVTGWLP
jgi:hypothetical protein